MGLPKTLRTPRKTKTANRSPGGFLRRSACGRSRGPWCAYLKLTKGFRTVRSEDPWKCGSKNFFMRLFGAMEIWIHVISVFGCSVWRNAPLFLYGEVALATQASTWRTVRTVDFQDDSEHQAGQLNGHASVQELVHGYCRGQYCSLMPLWACSFCKLYTNSKT